MKINIKEVSNPFLNVPNSKGNVRIRKHYSTIKKNSRLSLFESPSYKLKDNDDNNYYENILKRINGNDPPKNITFPSTPSGTKSKHMKIMYGNGASKRQKEKSSHNLTVSTVNQKLAKSLILSSKKRNISNEIIKSRGSLKSSAYDNNSSSNNMNNSNNNINHKEENELLLNSNDMGQQNNNSLSNNNKNSMHNLHHEKLNIISEENGDDYTVNANSKISFKKNSKNSLETINIKQVSEIGKKNIFTFVQVETVNQVEIHPVKITKTENIETNNMSLSNVGQSNQIERSSSHTTNKPPPLIPPAKQEIIQPLKASIKSHNSSNSFSSVNKTIKKKNIFLCCLPIK